MIQNLKTDDGHRGSVHVELHLFHGLCGFHDVCALKSGLDIYGLEFQRYAA